MANNTLDINITGDPGTGNIYKQDVFKRGAILQNFPNVTSMPQEEFLPMQITDIIKALANPTLKRKRKRKFDTNLYDFTPKIQFNRLDNWANIINKLKPRTLDVDRIYREFDKQAMDTSDAVLDWLHEQYDLLRKKHNGDDLFDEIQRRVYYYVSHDPELNRDIKTEVLNYNIRIVLVDAFMKCSIFEKPIEEDTAHAIA